MKITIDEVRRIAGLAHLEFDEASLEGLAGEMTRITGYIDQLRDLDVVAVRDNPTQLRDDAQLPSLERDAVAGNAPQWENGFFVVPKVIE